MFRLLALSAAGAFACACVSQTEGIESPPIEPSIGSSSAGADEVRIALPEVAPPEAEPQATSGDTEFSWWDRDGDGVLTEEELTETWVMRLDQDGDGVIARAEWPSP